jgi:hypothetical protein
MASLSILSKKKQMIILSACYAGVVTHQAHHTTSSLEGLWFFNVIYLYPNKTNINCINKINLFTKHMIKHKLNEGPGFGV